MKQSRLHAQHVQLGATFGEVTGWEMPVHYGDWRAEYDAVRQALVEDYLNGIPTTQLTTKYSLGKGSVLQILEDAGVPMRRQGLNEAEVEPDLAHGFGFWGPLSC